MHECRICPSPNEKGPARHRAQYHGCRVGRQLGTLWEIAEKESFRVAVISKLTYRERQLLSF